MLLCLDIGNSQIFGGLFDNSGTLQVQFRRTSQLRSSSDELGVFFRTVLRENDINPDLISEVSICCVVLTYFTPCVRAARNTLTLNPWCLGLALKLD